MEPAHGIAGDALAGLQEIPLPAPMSYLPHTIGWAIVAGLLLLALIYMCWRIVRHHRANAYRRQALAELDAIERSMLSTQLKPPLSALPALLKRTAIAATSREAVASLTGDQWLRFLDRCFTGDAFEKGAGRLLPRLAYAETLPDEVSRDQLQSLIALSRRWIRDHKAPVDPEVTAHESQSRHAHI